MVGQLWLGVVLISLVPCTLLLLILYCFCQCLCHELMEEVTARRRPQPWWRQKQVWCCKDRRTPAMAAACETTRQHAATTTVTARLRAVPKSMHAATSTTSQKLSALRNCTLSRWQDHNAMAPLQRPLWCHTISRTAVKGHGRQELEPCGPSQQNVLWTPVNRISETAYQQGSRRRRHQFFLFVFIRDWTEMSCHPVRGHVHWWSRQAVCEQC